MDEKVMKLPYFYRGPPQNAQDSTKRQKYLSNTDVINAFAV